MATSQAHSWGIFSHRHCLPRLPLPTLDGLTDETVTLLETVNTLESCQEAKEVGLKLGMGKKQSAAPLGLIQGNRGSLSSGAANLGGQKSGAAGPSVFSPLCGYHLHADTNIREPE